MPTPDANFWNITDLIMCLLSLLPWHETICLSHVNRRLRRETQQFVNSHINHLLEIFVPPDRIADLWVEVDTSGSAITGELPLALLARGPSVCKPIGNVLEFVVPLGEVGQLLALFQQIGYEELRTVPGLQVDISPSSGLANIYCLQKNQNQTPNPSEVGIISCFNAVLLPNV